MNRTQIIGIGIALVIVGAIAYKKLSQALTYRLGDARIRIVNAEIVLEQDITFYLKTPGQWQFVDFEGDVFYQGTKVGVATIDPFRLRREGSPTTIRTTIDPDGTGIVISDIIANPWMLTQIARKGFQVDGEALIELAGKVRSIPIQTTVLP